jgi:hypothetical protein
MPYKLFYTLDGIVLYQSSFFLSKRLSYSKFIEKAEKLNFFPYTLLFEQIPPTKLLAGCHVDTIAMIPPHSFFLENYSGLIILNKCLIRYSWKEREVVIKAGVGDGMFFALLLFCSLIAVGVFVANTISSIVPLGITLVIFIFLISIYRRDVRRFESIKAIALEEMDIT